MGVFHVFNLYKWYHDVRENKSKGTFTIKTNRETNTKKKKKKKKKKEKKATK